MVDIKLELDEDQSRLVQDVLTEFIDSHHNDNRADRAITVLVSLSFKTGEAQEDIEFFDAYLFNERGKYKYSMSLQMLKSDWDYGIQDPIRVAIDRAMMRTPEDIRAVSFTHIPQGYGCVVIENPWGYPIMVAPHE